jgi:hypothetical protein
MPAPDFVVAGHAVRDIVPGGWRLGGTVTFAAVQAHRLAYDVGVITRAAADLEAKIELPFAQVIQAPSDGTTTFENVYEAGHRRQRVRARAAPIEAADVPSDWRSSPIVLIGPVFGEIAPDFAAAFAEASLVGVSAQGWLRKLDAEGNVVRAAWNGEPFWRGADVLFVSDEDLADGRDELDAWTRDVPIVAMTQSQKGARVFADGRWRAMDAFPETEVDPTGAGDTFATGFLIRLHETGDVDEAARFGAAAASVSVGGIGAAAMPTRSEIEERMREHPEVALR